VRFTPLLLVLVLLGACASSGVPAVAAQQKGAVRQPEPAPAAPAPVTVDYDLPPRPLPERVGPAAPKASAPAAWRLPAIPPEPLPLPAVATVPPLPRPAPSATVNNPPAPSSNPAPAPQGSAASSPKPAVKPATKPIQPQSTAKAAPPPPTAAATASLLPADKTTGADFRWQDVNVAAGDVMTLHFEKTNWLYLDSPEQQKLLGFQNITRDSDATTFQFRPTAVGDYTLEFQRQDLTNQSTDVRRVKLTVVPPGTRTAATGTTLAPQTSSQSPDDPLEASRKLAASGKTSEAVKKLLQNYKPDDTRANLELARLLDQDGQNDDALVFLDRNLTLPGPDFQGTMELGTKLAAQGDPQKRLPTYVKLWTAGTAAPPEDLYLQVFDALRAGKLDQTKDWAGRYGLWYPQPAQRDHYLYVLGQFLEEPGPNRDVRGAWQAYDEIVNSYPLSPYWRPAGDRAAYLNRHFLQAR